MLVVLQVFNNLSISSWERPFRDMTLQVDEGDDTVVAISF